MKIQVIINKEVNIENPVFLETLRNWWEEHRPSEYWKCPDSLIKSAIKEVEEATGLPFGSDTAPETIIKVLNENDDTILNW